MSKRVVLRVAPRQYHAYQAAAIREGIPLHRWATNAFQVALGYTRLEHAADLEPAPMSPKSKQFAVRLSEQLEIDITDAAEESCISVTSWCMFVLDTVSGASRLVEYLRRCR